MHIEPAFVVGVPSLVTSTAMFSSQVRAPSYWSKKLRSPWQQNGVGLSRVGFLLSVSEIHRCSEERRHGLAQTPVPGYFRSNPSCPETPCLLDSGPSDKSMYSLKYHSRVQCSIWSFQLGLETARHRCLLVSGSVHLVTPGGAALALSTGVASRRVARHFAHVRERATTRVTTPSGCTSTKRMTHRVRLGAHHHRRRSCRTGQPVQGVQCRKWVMEWSR